MFRLPRTFRFRCHRAFHTRTLPHGGFGTPHTSVLKTTSRTNLNSTHSQNMVAEPRPVATTSTTAMRPNDIMLPQASLDLPTFASTFTDTSAYAVFTAAPTSAQYTNPPIKTNLPCILCGDALPGIDAGLPTYSPSYPVHTPTAAITGGDFILSPSYHGAVWYRQPWTIPAAWLLCCYVLCSCVVMGVLTYTGRLDMHGNVGLAEFFSKNELIARHSCMSAVSDASTVSAVACTMSG